MLLLTHAYVVIYGHIHRVNILHATYEDQATTAVTLVVETGNIVIDQGDARVSN